MKKIKKIRVLALALIAALIATIIVPLNSYAINTESINSEPGVGDVVVGTSIDVIINLSVGGGGYGPYSYRWCNSNDLSDQCASTADINGLRITDETRPSASEYSARLRGTPTTAGTIYFFFYYGGDTIAKTYTLTISPAPGGGAIVPGGGAVVPAGGAEKAPEVIPEKKPVVVTYIPPCEHTYEWQTITAATATADGEEAYVCTKCGDVKERRGLSAMGVFDQETANKILKAGQGATVNIECKPWNTFGHAVRDALIKRPDVTVKASFFSEGHKGIPLKVTLPAGSASLFDQNGYLGLCNAGTTLGYDQ